MVLPHTVARNVGGLDRQALVEDDKVCVAALFKAALLIFNPEELEGGKGEGAGCQVMECQGMGCQGME